MTSEAAPAPRRGDAPTGPSPDTDREVGRLRRRALEARERLGSSTPAIPAPRTPGGVEMPPSFTPGRGGTPPAKVLAALDELIADLAKVENVESPAHRALARIDELTATGVPEEGWSTREQLASDDLAAAATLAADLHTSAAEVLTALDAADLPAAAVAVDSLVTSLRVVRVVADLELFVVVHR